MDDIKPATWLLLGGGGLLAISSFLSWIDVGVSDGGLSTRYTGMQGIFVLLIGVALAGYGAVKAFGGDSVDLPDEVGPISVETMVVALGAAAFLIMFGLQFRESAGIGVTLGWIAAAAATVGAVLEADGSDGLTGGPPKGPPQRF